LEFRKVGIAAISKSYFRGAALRNLQTSFRLACPMYLTVNWTVKYNYTHVEGIFNSGDKIYLLTNADAFFEGVVKAGPTAIFGILDNFDAWLKQAGLCPTVGTQPLASILSQAGYISSIACLPASRGRGYGGAGLKRLLEHMRDAGQVLSTLFPFSFDYYRRFGWEWICPSRGYKVPTRILRSDPETEHVRTSTNEDRSGIKAMYRQFAGGYRGVVARDDIQWGYMLNDRKEHFT
jgi:ribosomal protein S18 acetylase RimI-like enzyme